MLGPKLRLDANPHAFWHKALRENRNVRCEQGPEFVDEIQTNRVIQLMIYRDTAQMYSSRDSRSSKKVHTL